MKTTDPAPRSDQGRRTRRTGSGSRVPLWLRILVPTILILVWFVMFGAGGVLRNDDLHDVQVGLETVGEPGRPAHGPLRGLRPVGADHHPAYRALDRRAHGEHHA